MSQTHARCSETVDCPCWEAGARAEVEAHRGRYSRSHNDLIEFAMVLSRMRPDESMADLADDIQSVFSNSLYRRAADKVWRIRRRAARALAGGRL